jgi:hypothetical protein
MKKIKGVRAKTYKRFWYIQNRINQGLRVRKKSLRFYNKYKNKIKIKSRKKEKLKAYTYVIKDRYGDIGHSIDFEVRIPANKVKDIYEAKEITLKVLEYGLFLGYSVFEVFIKSGKFEIGLIKGYRMIEVKVRGEYNIKLSNYLKDLLGD